MEKIKEWTIQTPEGEAVLNLEHFKKLKPNIKKKKKLGYTKFPRINRYNGKNRLGRSKMEIREETIRNIIS
jgi:hypothetical protein